MKTTLNQIGSFAYQVLERSNSGLVSGIASRGIYLQPRNDWAIYISLEDFRGPLTLNLADGSIDLKAITTGLEVELSPQEIRFPDGKLIISLEQAATWHAPRIDQQLQLDPDLWESIHTLAEKIAPENPYLPLLSQQPDQIPGVPAIGKRILNLQEAFKLGDWGEAAETAILLLGLGPGLTPLGDDFLLGLLLTLNRWGKGLDFPQDFTGNINQIILENSPIKTTRISSALLACAAEGAADERLLKVLDGMCSGKGVAQHDLRNLLRWGNTSGTTVLAGMMTGLSL